MTDIQYKFFKHSVLRQAQQQAMVKKFREVEQLFNETQDLPLLNNCFLRHIC